MERFTITIRNAQGFKFVTNGWGVGDFNEERFIGKAIEAMETSSNGSARVILFDGYTTKGDIVAQWYPKSRRAECRSAEAERVAEKIRAALSELSGDTTEIEAETPDCPTPNCENALESDWEREQGVCAECNPAT